MTKKAKKSFSYMQSLPTELYEELEGLCALYNTQNTIGVNKLTLQDIVRLILKSHMQALRGPTDIERMLSTSIGPTKFIPGPCPRCLLRVDKRNYPVLVEGSENVVKCHVCGATIPRKEVTPEDGW